MPIAQDFLYLVATMDWHSRYVVAWRLSNSTAWYPHPQAREP